MIGRVQKPDVKFLDFWEDLAPRMIQRTYRRFFRMNKEVLYDLVNYLNPQTRVYKGGRPQLEPDKMVAMTLYFLGNRSAYKQLATQSGISEDTFI